jgi:hypothetical protein
MNKKLTYKELVEKGKFWKYLTMVFFIAWFLFMLGWFDTLKQRNEFKLENTQLQEQLNSYNCFWTLKISCIQEGVRFNIEKDYYNYTEYKDASNLVNENINFFGDEFESCEVIK